MHTPTFPKHDNTSTMGPFAVGHAVTIWHKWRPVSRHRVVKVETRENDRGLADRYYTLDNGKVFREGATSADEETLWETRIPMETRQLIGEVFWPMVPDANLAEIAKLLAACGCWPIQDAPVVADAEAMAAAPGALPLWVVPAVGLSHAELEREVKRLLGDPHILALHEVDDGAAPDPALDVPVGEGLYELVVTGLEAEEAGDLLATEEISAYRSRPTPCPCPATAKGPDGVCLLCRDTEVLPLPIGMAEPETLWVSVDATREITEAFCRKAFWRHHSFRAKTCAVPGVFPVEIMDLTPSDARRRLDEAVPGARVWRAEPRPCDLCAAAEKAGVPCICQGTKVLPLPFAGSPIDRTWSHTLWLLPHDHRDPPVDALAVKEWAAEDGEIAVTVSAHPLIHQMVRVDVVGALSETTFHVWDGDYYVWALDPVGIREARGQAEPYVCPACKGDECDACDHVGVLPCPPDSPCPYPTASHDQR